MVPAEAGGADDRVDTGEVAAPTAGTLRVVGSPAAPAVEEKSTSDARPRKVPQRMARRDDSVRFVRVSGTKPAECDDAEVLTAAFMIAWPASYRYCARLPSGILQEVCQAVRLYG